MRVDWWWLELSERTREGGRKSDLARGSCISIDVLPRGLDALDGAIIVPALADLGMVSSSGMKT